MSSKFKLTYSTMFNPPDELHTNFEAALEKVKSELGQEYGMIINGADVYTDKKFEDHSPINSDWTLAVMQEGGVEHAQVGICCEQPAFMVHLSARECADADPDIDVVGIDFFE